MPRTTKWINGSGGGKSPVSGQRGRGSSEPPPLPALRACGPASQTLDAEHDDVPATTTAPDAADADEATVVGEGDLGHEADLEATDEECCGEECASEAGATTSSGGSGQARATRRAPRATRHSPLATRQSPIATRDSPCTTRDSPHVRPPTTYHHACVRDVSPAHAPHLPHSTLFIPRAGAHRP